MNRGCSGRLEMLSAHVDGELSADERADLESHLGSCAACERALLQLRELKASLSRGEARATLPAALEHRLERHPRARWRWPWAAAVAAAAVAIVAVAVFWPRSSPVEVLADDHLRYATSKAPWQFEAEAPAEAERALSGRLPFAFNAPALTGARLRGGRLCNLAGHPAAMLFYDRDGQRLSLFAFDNEGLGKRIGDGCDFSARGLNICVRRARGVAYALVSQLADHEMRTVLHDAFPHH